NVLANSNVRIPYSSAWFWMILLSCVMFIGLLAGSRPAFYLSAFNPVKVLKGATSGVAGGNFLSRRILVVVQFSCSVALIISTVVIYQQIQHAKNRPVGYSMDNLVTTFISDDLS